MHNRTDNTKPTRTHTQLEGKGSVIHNSKSSTSVPELYAPAVHWAGLERWRRLQVRREGGSRLCTLGLCAGWVRNALGVTNVHTFYVALS